MSLNDQDKKMDVEAHTSDIPATSPEEYADVVFDPDFSDPSAEIVLRSSDNLLFRVGANHLTVNR
jgi:hypothetical protein